MVDVRVDVSTNMSVDIKVDAKVGVEVKVIVGDKKDFNCSVSINGKENEGVLQDKGSEGTAKEQGSTEVNVKGKESKKGFFTKIMGWIEEHKKAINKATNFFAMLVILVLILDLFLEFELNEGIIAVYLGMVMACLRVFSDYNVRWVSILNLIFAILGVVAVIALIAIPSWVVMELEVSRIVFLCGYMASVGLAFLDLEAIKKHK